MGFDVLADSLSFHFLDPLHGIQFDSVRIVNITVGIAERHDLAAQLLHFLCAVDRYIARAGNNHGFADK